MSDTPPNLTPAEREQWAAATKATPGPWTVMKHGDDGSYIYLNCFPCDCWVNVTGSQRQQTSDHIAANAPDTVMARLRELSDLRGQVAALTAERGRLQDAIGHRSRIAIIGGDLWVHDESELPENGKRIWPVLT